MDDIFSALDANTTRYIYENCIKGDLLQGRTVVLVTHHLPLVQDYASKVVKLSHGRVLTENEMPKNDLLYTSSIDTASVIDKEEGEALPSADALQEDAKIVLEEERATGRLSPRLIFKYLGFMGAPIPVLCVFLSGFMESACTVPDASVLGAWAVR